MAYDIDSLKRLVLAKYPYFGSVLANVALEDTLAVDSALLMPMVGLSGLPM